MGDSNKRMLDYSSALEQPIRRGHWVFRFLPKALNIVSLALAGFSFWVTINIPPWRPGISRALAKDDPTLDFIIILPVLALAIPISIYGIIAAGRFYQFHRLFALCLAIMAVASLALAVSAFWIYVDDIGTKIR